MTNPGVDALVGKIAEGSAPENVRAAAARGALPLPRADLARLQVLLLDDENESIRQDAETSLSELPAEGIREVLRANDCDPGVLQHFANRAFGDEAVAELIAFHPAVPDKALAALAARGNSKVIELVLTNQERLLRQRGLIDVLTINPALTAGQRARVMELLSRLSDEIDAREEAAEAAGEVDTEQARREAEETARLLELDVGELYAASEIAGGEEFAESEDPAVRNAYQKIVTMNAAQKAILAMKGGREERQILIRDTNKVVALSALKNPRISETEVERIAMMRNVSDEVLRQISMTRDWAKNYTIIRELVRNPRTPPGVSQNLVMRLMNQDLKGLVRDRNVSEVIRRMAKRLHEQRTQQRNKFRR